MVFIINYSFNQIDKAMMDELKDVKRAINPTEVLLVVDAMTGQEAAGIQTSIFTHLRMKYFEGESHSLYTLSVVELHLLFFARCSAIYICILPIKKEKKNILRVKHLKGHQLASPHDPFFFPLFHAVQCHWAHLSFLL